MQPRLYDELTQWYDLIDPAPDHFDEAACYGDALAKAAGPNATTLIELGAGAGNNAFFLKRRFHCTLTDLSPAMLALNRTRNPDCEHIAGDMRTLKLGRTFDTVLVHDAVMYMTTLDDLRAAAATAFLHTSPGGAALFAPDCLRDTFREHTQLLQETTDDGLRAMRGLEWSWDPDPNDSTFLVEYAFVLRDGLDVTAVHDRHLEGLFSRATWLDVLSGVGYRVELVPRPIEDGAFDQVFLCRR